MAMATPCGGCEKTTSWIFAAQFCNGENEHVIICNECWDAGKRCFLGPNGLVVSNELPPSHKEAALYWDEGGFVTGGDLPITYPSVEQP